MESADDLDDLRVALHVAKWNLYGISYGTDLALTYVKLRPNGIRSVVIDGVSKRVTTRHAVSVTETSVEGFSNGLFYGVVGSPSAEANTCAYAVPRSLYDLLKKADTSCIRKVSATKFVL